MNANGSVFPYTMVHELFEELRTRFGDTDRVATKIQKLRTVKQGSTSADEHVQTFRKYAFGSGYKGHALIEEFKRSLNVALREKLMMAYTPPTMIEQWYKQAIRYDRNYRNMLVEQKLYGLEGRRAPDARGG